MLLSCFDLDSDPEFGSNLAKIQTGQTVIPTLRALVKVYKSASRNFLLFSLENAKFRLKLNFENILKTTKFCLDKTF